MGFCDLCFALIDCESELFFECEQCHNFAACLGCIKQKTRQLISHPSNHRFFPSKPPSNRHWINRNLNIICDLCNEKHFFGKRYQWQQCFDYDVCSKCLSEAEHSHYPSEQHTFFYVPNPTKIHSNRYLLADRTLQMLRHRNANPTDRDEITGWSLTEAEIIYADEMNSYYAAWQGASQILEDEDINFIPSIIEHEKIVLPWVLINSS
jgi:hypothetical protein